MEKAWLKVTLVRNYGPVGSIQIELHSEQSFDVNKGLIEFDQLTEAAQRMADHYTEHHVPKLKPTEHRAPVVTTVEVGADRMYVTMDKGKKYLKVICGQWTEHGVNMWPEAMKACGIRFEQIPEDGHKFKEGTKAVVEMEDGKPRRVVKFVTS